MHHGCIAGANGGEEAAAGWWRTWPSCRWGGRRITPANWPPTTRRTCLATGSPRVAGTATVLPRLACRAKHRWRGSSGCSRAATPTPASSWAAPMAATPCPRSMSCCARPKAYPSSTGSGMRRPDGRCWTPIRSVSGRRSPTWTDTLGRAAVTAVSSMCPDRGCWRSDSTIGRPGRGIRCCTPTW
jgi:hypothetical protein